MTDGWGLLETYEGMKGWSPVWRFFSTMRVVSCQGTAFNGEGADVVGRHVIHGSRELPAFYLLVQ
jgi:hypothetical protein